MLETSIKAWKEQWLAEGETKGETKGRAEALLSVLTERFGEVGPSWQKRVRRADPVTLELWLKRALGAPNLRSVFNPPRSNDLVDPAETHHAKDIRSAPRSPRRRKKAAI